jgi:hypothetical protein
MGGRSHGQCTARHLVPAATRLGGAAARLKNWCPPLNLVDMRRDKRRGHHVPGQFGNGAVEPLGPMGVGSAMGIPGAGSECLFGCNARVQVMRQSRFFVGGAGLAVAMLAFLAGLEVQFALARPSLERPGINPTPINRSLKGDRLPIIPGARGENPMGEPRLPKGCEHSFTSVRNAYANEVAGRCVASVPLSPGSRIG